MSNFPQNSWQEEANYYEMNVFCFMTAISPLQPPWSQHQGCFAFPAVLLNIHPSSVCEKKHLVISVHKGHSSWKEQMMLINKSDSVPTWQHYADSLQHLTLEKKDCFKADNLFPVESEEAEACGENNDWEPYHAKLTGEKSHCKVPGKTSL